MNQSVETRDPTERLTDVSDIASEQEFRANAEALRQAKLAAKPQQCAGADGLFPFPDCDDCGEEIGEERLRVAIKNRLCIYCANRREGRR